MTKIRENLKEIMDGLHDMMRERSSFSTFLAMSAPALHDKNRFGPEQYLGIDHEVRSRDRWNESVNMALAACPRFEGRWMCVYFTDVSFYFELEHDAVMFMMSLEASQIKFREMISDRVRRLIGPRK